MRLITKTAIAATAVSAIVAASAVPVALPEAHVIDNTASMLCGGQSVTITAKEYDALKTNPFPTVNGKQCTQASAENIYDTPSGTLEVGYYIQTNDGYLYLADENEATATSTVTKTVAKQTSNIPTESLLQMMF